MAKKAFIHYKGIIDHSKKEEIEIEVNRVKEQNLPIVTKYATYEEIAKESKFMPPNLPKNKTLRMLKIGNYPAMADGGVQVKNTAEIGKIWIANIYVNKEETIVRYGVVGS